MKILFIVESPAKAKTIAGYLKDVDKNNTYTVKASMGHVRDLREGGISIEIDNDFEMLYAPLPTKSRVIKELQDAARNSDMVYLATDNDREGESIAWHLSELIKGKRMMRVLFNEITKSAIKDAVSNPGEIKQHLVDAQQARRCIDRLVGFTISPVLWKTFNRKTLSAGRVQSAVMSLLMNRENEITGFDSDLYWEVHGEFHTLPGAVLFDNQDETAIFTEKDAVIKVMKQMGSVDNFDTSEEFKERKEYPGSPYITSSLQQDAYKSFGMGSKYCMQLAQQLYENGFITYMRTDSHQLSAQAHGMIKSHVLDNYGEEYYKHRSNQGKKIKGSQEAHEAIRPTDLKNVDVSKRLSAAHAKLYKMIYQRTVASQMADAVHLDKIIKIEYANKDNYYFRTVQSKLKFAGFHAAYGKQADKITKDKKVDSQVTLKSANAINKITLPPQRYNEGSLVKALERAGIGRPSTYSSIIEKILKKEYAEVETTTASHLDGVELVLTGKTVKEEPSKIALPAEKNRIRVTESGRQVYEFLNRQFGVITDLKFTAEMEEKLDMVAQNQSDYLKTVSGFWGCIKPLIDKVTANAEKIKLPSKTGKVYTKAVDLPSGVTVTVRTARYGPVIELADKKFVDLKAIIKATGVEIEQLPDNTIEFLARLPQPCTNIAYELNYGRYGFYYTNGDKNVSITDTFVKTKHAEIDKLLEIDEATLMANRNQPPKYKRRKKSTAA